MKQQQRKIQKSSELKITLHKEKLHHCRAPHREAQQNKQPEYLNVTSSQSQNIRFQKEQKQEGQAHRNLEFFKKKGFKEMPNTEKHQPVEAQHHPL